MAPLLFLPLLDCFTDTLDVPRESKITFIPLEGPPLTDLEIDKLYQDEALESL
jgi:hypothetical protein